MMVREAEAMDASAIQKIYAEVMDYHCPLEQMAKMIEFVHADAANYVFVLEEDGSVRGVCETVIKYSIHRASYLIINSLAVNAGDQDKGYGTQLLSYVESFAKQKQLGSIRVGSQVKRVRAHHFYDMNGFQMIKEHKIFEKAI